MCSLFVLYWRHIAPYRPENAFTDTMTRNTAATSISTACFIDIFSFSYFSGCFFCDFFMSMYSRMMTAKPDYADDRYYVHIYPVFDL